MTTWLAGLMGVLLLGCGPSPVAAQGSTTRTRVRVQSSDGGGKGSWIGGSPLRTRVVVGEDGETYVGVWIDAPRDVPQARERAPMAVSLVVDTSGSMSGEKIANARMAASSLLESLSDGDLVSIYGFNNQVTEIAPPTVVNRRTRPGLVSRASQLYAGGGTNLYGGINAGVSRMAQVSMEHPIRRVVVISDGHANIGPSDPASLGHLAARGTEWSTQISAIGVGLGYDEHTLGSLAVHSAGRLYHLQHSAQMASILEKELHLLANTVATDAYIELVPAPNVRILEGATPGVDIRRGRVRVKLGSVHAGQEREVLLRAKLDTSQPGSHPVGTARLVFERPGEGGQPVVQERSLRYEVTDDRAAAHNSEAPRVVAMVATHEAAQAQLRAAKHLNRGEGEQAAQELAQAQKRLQRAAQRAPAGVRRKLKQQAAGAGRAARKARSVRSAAQGRAGALEANDMAMEAQGF